MVYETERKKDGQIMFGGCHHDNKHDLVGTTRYLFHLLGHSLNDDQQLLKGLICCGGGPVSIQEYQEFFKMGYPCYYLPVQAKCRVTDPDLEWGQSDTNSFGIVHQVSHVPPLNVEQPFSVCSLSFFQEAVLCSVHFY